MLENQKYKLFIGQYCLWDNYTFPLMPWTHLVFWLHWRENDHPTKTVQHSKIENTFSNLHTLHTIEHPQILVEMCIMCQTSWTQELPLPIIPRGQKVSDCTPASPWKLHCYCSPAFTRSHGIGPQPPGTLSSCTKQVFPNSLSISQPRLSHSSCLCRDSNPPSPA